MGHERAANQLWINDGTGRAADGECFSTGTSAVSGDKDAFTRVAAWADVNGDGYPDLFVGNYGQLGADYSEDNGNNELYINDGSGGFTAATGNVVSGHSYTTAVAFGDIDGDNDVDLFVGNGKTDPRPRKELWINDGSGGFIASAGGGFTSTDVNACSSSDCAAIGAAAFVDVDGDGDLDLVRLPAYSRPPQAQHSHPCVHGSPPSTWARSGRATTSVPRSCGSIGAMVPLPL